MLYAMANIILKRRLVPPFRVVDAKGLQYILDSKDKLVMHIPETSTLEGAAEYSAALVCELMNIDVANPNV